MRLADSKRMCWQNRAHFLAVFAQVEEGKAWSRELAVPTAMDNDRWNHVDKLLQSALDRPAVDRDVFLRNASGGDSRLEDEVRSLLVAHNPADRFLGAPAINLAARELAGERSADGSRAGDDPLIGQSLSHYRIFEKLGGGGPAFARPRVDRELHMNPTQRRAAAKEPRCR